MEKFTVSQCILEHNHEISDVIFKLYPDQRRPAGHLAEEVDNMLSVNGNPTLVAQVLHKEGLAVRVKDIHNRKRKLAEAGSSLPDRLRQLLEAPHINYRILETEAHQFQALFFQTERQRSTFAKFGEMLQMDATYKVCIFVEGDVL